MFPSRSIQHPPSVQVDIFPHTSSHTEGSFVLAWEWSARRQDRMSASEAEKVVSLLHLMQVGHKSFMYMHLYAEATLALVETPFREIQFKQIVGDFQTLQGKIMVQEDSLDKAWYPLGCTTAMPYYCSGVSTILEW